MFQKKPSASEVDGVQYRRAKLWQIICYACNAFVGMSVYSLIGMASYSASIGYGITTATVGLILMLARILDGFTDPMLAFVYDRVNTRFGKLRVLLISGYLIEAVGLLCMFNLCSSKGFGLPVFALTYIIYIIGYTVTNMTAQTLPAIMTNDPRQRPTIGVWSTALNYAVPMGMSISASCSRTCTCSAARWRRTSPMASPALPGRRSKPPPGWRARKSSFLR